MSEWQVYVANFVLDPANQDKLFLLALSLLGVGHYVSHRVGTLAEWLLCKSAKGCWRGVRATTRGVVGLFRSPPPPPAPPPSRLCQGLLDLLDGPATLDELPTTRDCPEPRERLTCGVLQVDMPRGGGSFHTKRLGGGDPTDLLTLDERILVHTKIHNVADAKRKEKATLAVNAYLEKMPTKQGPAETAQRIEELLRDPGTKLTAKGREVCRKLDELNRELGEPIARMQREYEEMRRNILGAEAACPGK